MRTLGIDFGTRRIGLALSDESGRFVTPYDVLQVSSPELAIDPILAIIQEEGVQRLVIGLPLNMDGSVGGSARDVAAWAQRLHQKTGTALVFVDERLSSFAAEQELNDRKRAGEKLTRKRRREQLDAVAATGFLQAFLDGKLPAVNGVGSSDDSSDETIVGR